MSKKKIGSKAYVCPMPMSIVGAVVNGKPNFLAVAWFAPVNSKPSMIAIALGKSHYTNAGIHEHKEFSVNIPGIEIMKSTDYCGLVSGKNTDKSSVFNVFNGELKHAPMIEDCPLTMECVLVKAVDLPGDTLFIGEVKYTYCNELCMTDGNPDIEKMKLFTLSPFDKYYWSVGKPVAKAWSIGKK